MGITLGEKCMWQQDSSGIRQAQVSHLLRSKASKSVHLHRDVVRMQYKNTGEVPDPGLTQNQRT